MKDHSASIHVQVPVDVATFLLNEKRADIHLVESRLKVNVTIIPNPHMETPHYNVTRLRHDELNQRDSSAPSYKMATMPEADSVYQSEKSVMPARQEAAVKSIAPPQQLVPSVQPTVAIPTQSQGSLLDRIVGWFKKRGDETIQVAEAPAVEPVLTTPRSDRPSERRDRKSGQQRRGRNEGRNGEGRGENRNAEGQRRHESEPRQNEPRANDSAKPSRPPRQPKPRVEVEAALRVEGCRHPASRVRWRREARATQPPRTRQSPPA